jgi:predicted TIM-barrel fold metal-dependent hydrolase
MSTTPYTCLAPRADIEPAAFDMPAGACDTHAHVISDDLAAYPLVANRAFNPVPATEAMYLDMLRRTGMSRGVLVQVSVYGSDNRYLLDVLSRHGDRLRGVVVIEPDLPEAELQRMHALGVRGARINVLVSGGVGFDALEALAERIAPLGWHLQLFMDVRSLPAMMPRLEKLPCPCVVDHIGHMPASLTVADPGFQALMHMVATQGWWVKLSGAFRISDDHFRYRDVTPMAQALIALAPDRMVWGSDWPHVNLKDHMPDTGALRNLLAVWAPEAADRQRILVDNPARLYGFADGAGSQHQETT